MTTETPKGTDVDARLAAATALLDEDDTRRAEIQKERDVILLELDVKLRSELGARGEDFEIVDAGPEGPIAVKLGPSVLYKKYKGLVKREKDTEEELYQFVAPCVAFPDRDRFNEIIGRRSHMLTKAGDALLRLYGAWEEKRQGKY